MAFRPPTLSSALSRTTPESRAATARTRKTQRGLYDGVPLEGDRSPLKFTHNDRIPHECKEDWKKPKRKDEPQELTSSGDPVTYPKTVWRGSPKMQIVVRKGKNKGKKINANGKFAKKLTPEELKAYFKALPWIQQ
jgi:hypothetical protein